MSTRREFLGTLFRSVATAAAMCYAPSVLVKPRSNVICDDVVTVNGIKKEFSVAMDRFRQFKDKNGRAYFEPSAEQREFLAERAQKSYGYFEQAPDMKAIVKTLKAANRRGERRKA